MKPNPEDIKILDIAAMGPCYSILPFRGEEARFEALAAAGLLRKGEHNEEREGIVYHSTPEGLEILHRDREPLRENKRRRWF